MPDFPYEVSMTMSDWIAILALVIAFLSALYTRDARDAARKANEIAARNNLRPSRLDVFRLMLDFADYCGTYRTYLSLGTVKGTRDLANRIDNFKWEIARQGPLAMPDVESKIKVFQNKAWQMQRLLDRLDQGRNNPEDRNYQTGEENLDAIVDWFANEQKELKVIFQPYLGST